MMRKYWHKIVWTVAILCTVTACHQSDDLITDGTDQDVNSGTGDGDADADGDADSDADTDADADSDADGDSDGDADTPCTGLDEQACEEAGCVGLGGWKADLENGCWSDKIDFVGCATMEGDDALGYAVDPKTDICYQFSQTHGPDGWEVVDWDDDRCVEDDCDNGTGDSDTDTDTDSDTDTDTDTDSDSDTDTCEGTSSEDLFLGGLAVEHSTLKISAASSENALGISFVSLFDREDIEQFCVDYDGLTCYRDHFNWLLISVGDQKAWDALNDLATETNDLATVDWESRKLVFAAKISGCCAEPYTNYKILEEDNDSEHFQVHADVHIWPTKEDDCDGICYHETAIWVTTENLPTVGLYGSEPCGETSGETLPI